MSDRISDFSERREVNLLSFISPIDDTSPKGRCHLNALQRRGSLQQCTLVSFKKQVHPGACVGFLPPPAPSQCRFDFCTFSRSQAVKAAVTAVPLCSHFCPTSGSGEISPGEMCLSEVGSTKGATVNLLRSMAPDHLQVRVVGIMVKCRKGQVRCRRREQERSSIEKGCQLMSTQN